MAGISSLLKRSTWLLVCAALLLRSSSSLVAAEALTDGLPLELKGKIKKVALIEPDDTPILIADLSRARSAGMWSFGILRFLDADRSTQGMMKKKAKDWAGRTQEMSPSIVADLAANLRTELEKQGLEVVLVKAKHPKPGEFVSASLFEKPPESADLYLDLVVEHGYFHHHQTTKERTGSAAKWIPRVAVAVYAYRPGSTKPVLFCGGVNHGIDERAITLSMSLNWDKYAQPMQGIDPAHVFDSHEELMAHPDLAIQGMQAAAKTTAAKVANTLRLKPAVVYFIRPTKTFMTSDWQVFVKVDGQSLPALAAKSVVYTTVDPGEHAFELRANFPTSNDLLWLKVNVEADRAYYYTAEVKSLQQPPVTLDFEDDVEGRKLLMKYGTKQGK
jgi:hypothetical protein